MEELLADGFHRLDVRELVERGRTVPTWLGQYFMVRFAPVDAPHVAVEVADPNGGPSIPITGITTLRARSAAGGWFGFGAAGAAAAHLAAGLERQLAGWEVTIGTTNESWWHLRALSGPLPELEIERALQRLRGAPAPPTTSSSRTDAPTHDRIRRLVPTPISQLEPRLAATLDRAPVGGISSLQVHDADEVDAACRTDASFEIDLIEELDHDRGGSSLLSIDIVASQGAVVIYPNVRYGSEQPDASRAAPRLRHVLDTRGWAHDELGYYHDHVIDPSAADLTAFVTDLLAEAGVRSPLVVEREGPGPMGDVIDVVYPDWQWVELE